MKLFQVPWMKKKLSPPFNAEDDLVLEIVVFLGTCISDATAAHFVCKTGLLDSLIDLVSILFKLASLLLN